MTKPNLEELVKSAEAGGRREVGALLRTLRPLICRWALVWTGSPDTAEDVAQRVLMNVNRSIHTYGHGAKVTTWLYRITRNVLIDQDREDSSDRRFRDRLELDRLAQKVAEQDHARSHAQDLLKRLMQDLSPRQRAVLDLVDLQGFDAIEVADMLELSPATVRVHLHRAREALRTGDMDNDRTYTAP
jgi:RNA polymerase sigma-70 factor (ECF subfamily)